jgi:hypothetical protein
MARLGASPILSRHKGTIAVLCTILPNAAHIPCCERRFHGRRLIFLQEIIVFPVGTLAANVIMTFNNLQ